MKNRKIDRDMPIGKLKKMYDFLPLPKELVMPTKTGKTGKKTSKREWLTMHAGIPFLIK